MSDLEYLKKYLHEEDNFEEAVKRLKNGEPVQYIVGDVNFYGNIIKVNKAVLIPRRETEELVEKTVCYVKKIFGKQCVDILDIGTGSGCISISIAKLIPNSKISAVDISNDALEVAKENAKLNNVQIDFIQSNIFNNINQKYDCIISNPPYIRKDEKIMDIVKNNEPHLALYADDEGLFFYKEIIKNAVDYLNKKFIIGFEIGEEQGDQVVDIAKKYFPKAKIILEKDMQHLDRFVFIINE